MRYFKVIFSAIFFIPAISLAGSVIFEDIMWLEDIEEIYKTATQEQIDYIFDCSGLSLLIHRSRDCDPEDLLWLRSACENILDSTIDFFYDPDKNNLLYISDALLKSSEHLSDIELIKWLFQKNMLSPAQVWIRGNLVPCYDSCSLHYQAGLKGNVDHLLSPYSLLINQYKNYSSLEEDDEYLLIINGIIRAITLKLVFLRLRNGATDDVKLPQIFCSMVLVRLAFGMDMYNDHLAVIEKLYAMDLFNIGIMLPSSIFYILLKDSDELMSDEEDFTDDTSYDDTSYDDDV